MELVQMLLGSEPNPSTAQLQHAGRKLEAVGFQVGERLVERYTKERPRFSDTLEIIKFICKDFWYEVYRKHIDKLQTNNRARRHRPPPTRSTAHPPARPPRTRSPAAAAAAAAAGRRHRQLRQACTSDVSLDCDAWQGVYMLQDNKHKLLARCSPSSARTASAKQMGALHAKYPAGLIRGALGRAQRVGAGHSIAPSLA